MRILLIDDQRDISIIKESTRASASAIMIARTYDEGLRQITVNGPCDLVILDNDLGCFVNGVEYSGYDIAKFIYENPYFVPGDMDCCSGNPVARERILRMIDDIYKNR